MRPRVIFTVHMTDAVIEQSHAAIEGLLEIISSSNTLIDKEQCPTIFAELIAGQLEAMLKGSNQGEDRSFAVKLLLKSLGSSILDFKHCLLYIITCSFCNTIFVILL